MTGWTASVLGAQLALAWVTGHAHDHKIVCPVHCGGDSCLERRPANIAVCAMCMHALHRLSSSGHH